MSWPFQAYEALPAGERWENFFHVLAKIGITPPDLNKEFSPTFGDRVYNELYDRTNGLLINQALVSPPFKFRVHDHLSPNLLPLSFIFYSGYPSRRC
jgi:hypothetical protein